MSVTTSHTNASELYLKYFEDSPRFCIIYKSSLGTELYVKFKNGEDGLELVRSAHIEDTSFMLENTKRGESDTRLPATPHDWAKQGSYFIKRVVKPRIDYYLKFNNLFYTYVGQYLVSYFTAINYTAVGQQVMGSLMRPVVSRSKIDDKHDHEMLFYVNYKFVGEIKDESMLYLERDIEETSSSFLNVNAKETTCTCRTSVVLAIVLCCLIAMVATVVAHVF